MFHRQVGTESVIEYLGEITQNNTEHKLCVHYL